MMKTNEDVLKSARQAVLSLTSDLIEHFEMHSISGKGRVRSFELVFRRQYNREPSKAEVGAFKVMDFNQVFGYSQAVSK